MTEEREVRALDGEGISWEVLLVGTSAWQVQRGHKPDTSVLTL